MDFQSFYKIFKSSFESDLVSAGNYKGHNYIYAPIQYVLKHGGKQLRPSILGAIAYSLGETNYHQILPAARAVEMVHNFTLIHDDIMDRDELRHGRETVYKKYGDNAAILGGDGLFVLALQQLDAYLSKPKIYSALMSVLLNGVMKVCEGQADDIAYEVSRDVSVRDYLAMVENKTSWLIAVSGRMGTILARAQSDLQIRIQNILLKLGVVFQIQDDMLELQSNAKSMGKSLGSDLVKEKKTFPYLTAREKMDYVEWERFRGMIRPEFIGKEGIKPACDCLEKNGIFNQCDLVISRYHRDMQQMIATLPDETRKMMLSMTDFILNRKK